VPEEAVMKKKLEPINLLYPTPTVLVGTVVNDTANFITIAHVGIVNHARPFLISLSMGKIHHTNAGIKENKAFSVNIPSESLVAETDYVGLVTGKKVDKSKLFELFYGKLKNAPLITSCPVNMACRLNDIYDTPTHDLFIGEIVETYADESVLDGNTVDIARVKPLLFDMSSKKYWSLGPALADCWRVGMTIKKKNRG
jgi:flavin reductase (DIM6/NTAB) family NADH-FMN oxidoreductase RutF